MKMKNGGKNKMIVKDRKCNNVTNVYLGFVLKY